MRGASFDSASGQNAMPPYCQMRFVEDSKIGAIIA